MKRYSSPLSIFAALFILGLCAVPAHALPGWDNTGSMGTAREIHTATLLHNGKVLVTGGANNTGFLTSSELYDPATRTWGNTGSMFAARGYHTATLLQNGKVLVAAGYGSYIISSSELYNPVTRTWSTTGPMSTARGYHTATLLQNGRVLVAGGYNEFDSASAELYNPGTGKWDNTGLMVAGREEGHTATLLLNGKVLIAGGTGYGGVYLSSAELYDPGTGIWTATGSMAAVRYYHTATLLPNGKVLIAGGYNGSAISSAQLYDPATGQWSGTGPMTGARYLHRATLLQNGKVLVAGGSNSSAYLSSAELYDPETETWSTAGSMAVPRGTHTATLIPNGKVLVTGGHNFTGSLSSAEIYRPARKVPGDYDGDGKNDITIFRPSSGYWFTGRSSDGGSTATQFGISGDIPIPGDYDGDGKTDIAFYRPSNGAWYIICSSDNTSPAAYAYGVSGDIPVPGDYDGDGKTDIAIYRPSSGNWFIVRSSDGTTQAVQFGVDALGDIPVPGDYDGDGKIDIAIYRQAYGYWFILSSKDGTSSTVAFGEPSLNDTPVPGDYDGDGKTDIAVYRQAYGYWFILNSKDGTSSTVAFGEPSLNDQPVVYRGGGGGGDGSDEQPPLPPSLVSISVTPDNPSIPWEPINLRVAKQLTATGIYSDGTSHDISTLVIWNSSNPAVATVSSGLVTANAPGTASIVATSGSITGSTTLTVVTLSSLSVTPGNPSIPSSFGMQFTATGIYSDGTSYDISPQVTWNSSNTAVATINSSGLAIGKYTAGTSIITATYGTISGNTTLTVTFVNLSSISITPVNPSIPGGSTTLQFTATGVFRGGESINISTSVTWNSSNPAVATINSSGLATAVAPGTTTITATFGTASGTTTLTVPSLSSISVTPGNPSIIASKTKQFTATGTYSDGSSLNLTSQVIWNSSNPAVATINSGGLATAVAPGTTTITATFGTISGNTILTVAHLTSIAIFHSYVRTVPGPPAEGDFIAYYCNDVGAGSLNSAIVYATGTYSDGTIVDAIPITWALYQPPLPASQMGLEIVDAGHAKIHFPWAGGGCVSPGGTATLTATSGSITNSVTLYID